MSVIKIDNFGGELPSVSPRALPANGAQENRNLYLGTSEFRPLAQDTTVASTANGTRTLHRFARDASGNFNTNPSTGWITSTQERSYVKVSSALTRICAVWLECPTASWPASTARKCW